MANVLGTLFGEIASAIREKTGDTDTMKPAAFPEKILGIEAGSSADVCYVTFMSYDGTVAYGKKAVAVGDDCADPIDRGMFSTPTRESDVQYDYTFYGWATTPNGAADATWNQSVTEDKMVYANFSTAVRYYTVTYYDSDGTTVLKTESLAYGTVPSYAAAKTGYRFEGWSPDPVAVTGAAAYYAAWSELPAFTTATWAEIDAVCQAGDAASAFSIGDTRTVAVPIRYTSSFGPTLDIEFQIVGFNIEDKEDGTKASITMASTYPLFFQYLGTNNDSNLKMREIGWENCGVRSTLNDTLLPVLPSDLQAVIKPVKKVSNAPSSAASASNVTTVDKLWIPSVTEYGLSSSYTATGQGYVYSRLYSIRKSAGINSSGTLSGDTANNSDYCKHATRSDSTQYTYQMIVNHLGNASNDGTPSYARFCFCI